MNTVWKEKLSTENIHKGHFVFIRGFLPYVSVLPYRIGIGQMSIEMRLEGKRA
jgi:hypothetical protein